MTLVAAGLNYKTAPVEVRERLSAKPSELVSAAWRLKLRGDLDEIVFLSTCNRVEIYGTTSRLAGRIDSLFRVVGGENCDLQPHLYVHEDIAAARHLFRVAAGLDSMVLGETEIMGQVKNAYKIAQTAGLTGAVLNRVFQRAFQAVKEIRTRTGIGRGATSVGSVTVELVQKIFQHDLSSQTVVIVGAGQMSEACVHHLAEKGARSILVSNRSFERAVELATKFGGRALPFEDCLSAIAGADIVIASTSCPKIVLHCADLEKLMVTRRNRPLILIDISVPRNIDPAAQGLDNVYLYNIDDLQAIVRQNVLNRQQELALCRQIIESRAMALMEKLQLGKQHGYDAREQFQSSWLSPRTPVAVS